MNVVMTEKGGFVEIQGTAEAEPFDQVQLDAMMQLARQGIEEILAIQRQALEAP